MPYKHWNRLTATLRVDNRGSQKSEKYQITMFITIKSSLVLSLKPFEAY
jgi:hypothetical protein